MIDEAIEEEIPEPASAASPIKIVIIAVIAAVVLSGAMTGGAMYMVGMFGDTGATADVDEEEVAEAEEEAAEEEAVPRGPAQYHSMDPKFVISFNDTKSARFMQFSLQLMTRNNEIMHHIESHMPAIRSSLLMLIGQKTYAEMSTLEGKEKLLVDIVDDVNETLVDIADVDPDNGIQAAYFDSFVIQ